MSLLTFYDFCLRSNPLATKMVTNFAICCTGDLICQAITRANQVKEEEKQDWDAVRVARFGAVGACVQTTLLHWYLTKIVPAIRIRHDLVPDKSTRRIAKVSLRLGVHLTTLLPFRIGAIFFALYSLQHLSVTKGYERLTETYADGLRAAYCYWPFVLIGLYTVVPSRYGNLYFDTFNLFWAVAMSYFASRGTETPPKTISSQHNSSGKFVETTSSQRSHSSVSQSPTKRNLENLKQMRPSPISYAEAWQQEQPDKVEFEITPRLPSERRAGSLVASESPSKEKTALI